LIEGCDGYKFCWCLKNWGGGEVKVSMRICCMVYYIHIMYMNYPH